MANCTIPRGPLDAENDIVGPGALAAFFTTAAITYLTVILAYITDKLDKSLINPLDAKVIEMTRKLLFRPKLKNHDRESAENKTSTTRPDQSEDTVRDAWKDAISNFLISLSDQQLVTGLAILVAAVSGQQSLTGYDFSVATCLGWFSCTTHLAAIDVLGVRFTSHGIIRHFRVAGLVCLMGLLSYSFIRTTSISSFSVPIECPRNTPSVDYYDVICLLPLWVEYFSAVRKTYLGRHISFWDVTQLIRLKSRGKEAQSHSAGDWVPFSRVDQLNATNTERRTQEIEDLIDGSQEHARFRVGLVFYDGSFLETFPGMTYSLCFGIAQIVLYRWGSPELSEESTELGFGQITALLLLILPFLAIGEALKSNYDSAYSGASQIEVASREGTDPSDPSPGNQPGNPPGNPSGSSPIPTILNFPRTSPDNPPGNSSGSSPIPTILNFPRTSPDNPPGNSSSSSPIPTIPNSPGHSPRSSLYGSPNVSRVSSFFKSPSLDNSSGPLSKRSQHTLPGTPTGPSIERSSTYSLRVISLLGNSQHTLPMPSPVHSPSNSLDDIPGESQVNSPGKSPGEAEDKSPDKAFNNMEDLGKGQGSSPESLKSTGPYRFEYQTAPLSLTATEGPSQETARSRGHIIGVLERPQLKLPKLSREIYGEENTGDPERPQAIFPETPRGSQGDENTGDPERPQFIFPETPRGSQGDENTGDPERPQFIFPETPRGSHGDESSGDPDNSQGSHGDENTGELVSQSQSLEEANDLDQYFPLEMKKLSLPTQCQDLETLRHDLLQRYNLVKSAERSMSLRWPMALFGLHLSIVVMASAFLNSYDYRLGLAGTSLNIISIVPGNLKSVRQIFGFLELVELSQMSGIRERAFGYISHLIDSFRVAEVSAVPNRADHSV